MRFKRILASVLTVACLFTCFATTASAKNASAYAIGDTASPQYSIATSVSSDLYISGTKAECISQGSGLDTVQITIVQTLQEYSGWFWIWDDVATWTKTINSSSTSFTNTKSGLSSGKYRVKSVFTFTNVNGKTETITIYSDTEKI